VRAGNVLLFDCGEGTQFRLLHAGLKRSRVEAIFVSHFHGDHFFGIMGMVTTLSMLKRYAPLTIVAPAGIRDIMHCIPGLVEEALSFPLHYVEIEETFEHGVVYRGADFWVEARPLEHRIFTLGYRYQERDRPGNLDVALARTLGISAYEDFRALKAGVSVRRADDSLVHPGDVVVGGRKGRIFSYCSDTRPCGTGVLLARDADLLYHEATFEASLQQRAIETGHSTTLEAAQVAREAGVKRLIMGHFSARYKDTGNLVREAQQLFEAAEAADELKRYALSDIES
jgi:ribonuclease Z